MAFITKIGAGVDAWLDSRQSISKKIGYGYGVAISIAALGALLGLAIGSHAQQKAQEALEVAKIQQNTLNKLSLLSLSLQSHPQRLLVVLQEPIWFQYEMSKFTNDFNQAKALLAELDSFINLDTSQENLDVETLETLVQSYDSTIEGYRQHIAALWKRINPQELTRETADPAQQLILASLTDAEAVRMRLRFEKLSERLVQIQWVAENQKTLAYQHLDQADAFRFHAIISGIVLSTAIAIALGIITSRAIARPVQELTDVAQLSIQDAKFDLQASVSSNDEIGSLAQSFNQLIAFVNQLLQQQQAANEKLEAYSQSLEQKVLLRTQELQEKNDHLKQLLEELHRTQTQMVQSEKMSSLGQLVAGVAHEINNPVNFIHGNLEHLNTYTQDLIRLVQAYEKDIPDPPAALQETLEEIDLEFLTEDLQKILQSMRIGTGRIREIVLSLRNFSRLNEAEFKPADIHEGIDNTLLILQHRLKPKADRPEIQVIKEYGDLPMVECYPGQLNQVFMNLITNSIDALEEVNQARSFQEISEHPNVIQIKTQLIDSDWAEVMISDNGTGIPETVRSRLFDPFFTTKPVGKGTGLGLSISYQIVVDKHKGRMHCESTPGRGTTFVMRIPVRHTALVSA